MDSPNAGKTLNNAAPIAVIDLGTNTFHLLIVRRTGRDDAFEEVHRERYFVKLAEDGIEQIGPAAMERAQHALIRFRKAMDAKGVDNYRAFGTAALRTATNGPDFVHWATTKAKIQITTIDGGEEARLISRGVLQAIPPLSPSERILIMDIGGGSVEFIIADKEAVRYAQSFPVGVAVLKRQFHQQEPISNESLASMQDGLLTMFKPLQLALNDFPTNHLIGAAGTFDVIAKLMTVERPTAHSHRIDLSRFPDLFARCRQANLEERMQMEDIPNDRADMIVVALALIQKVLKMAQIEQLTVSDYSLKEGALLEIE